MLFSDSLTHPLILLNLMLFWGALNPFHSGIGSSSIRVEWLKTDKRRWIRDELSGSEVLKCNSLFAISLQFNHIIYLWPFIPPPLLYRRRTQRMCLSNRLNRPEATQNPVIRKTTGNRIGFFTETHFSIFPQYSNYSPAVQASSPYIAYARFCGPYTIYIVTRMGGIYRWKSICNLWPREKGCSDKSSPGTNNWKHCFTIMGGKFPKESIVWG